MSISSKNLTEADVKFLQQQKAKGLDAQTAYANLDAQKKKENVGGFFKGMFGGKSIWDNAPKEKFSINPIEDAKDAFNQLKDTRVGKAITEGVDSAEAQRETIAELQKTGEISNTEAFGRYSMNALNKMIQPVSKVAMVPIEATKDVLDATAGKLVPLLTKLIGEENIDAFQKKVFDTPVMNTDAFSGDLLNKKTPELKSLNEAYNSALEKYAGLAPKDRALVDETLTSLDSVFTLVGGFELGTTVGKPLKITSQAFKESLGKLKADFPKVNPLASVEESFNGLKGAVNRKVTGFMDKAKASLPQDGILKNAVQKIAGTVTDKTSVGALEIRPVANILEAGAELEKKGFEKSFVEFLQKATPDDQSSFKKMLGLAEKNQGEFKTTTRPIEVPGEDLTKRAETLFEERTTQGKLKDDAIKAMPDEPVNVDDTYSKFMAELEEKGIYLEDDPITGPRVITKDSPLSSAENKLIKEVVLTLRKPMTPKKIDLLRQKIFYALNLGKKQSTMGDLGDALLQNLRTNLKNPLDEISQKMGLGYTEAAEKYATYSKALYDFTKLLGYKGFPEDITKQSLRAGEILNRILGNASARPTEIIQPIIDLSSALGFKGGSPLDQIQFADILENIFGTTQTRGFKGEINRGVGQALEAIDTAKNVATGNVGGLTEKLIRKVYGVTKENQIKALKNFLDMLESNSGMKSIPEEL